MWHEVVLYCTSNRYKYFERWATANEFPVNNLINDGTTTLENRYNVCVVGVCSVV